MNRPTDADVERLFPSGAYYIPCDRTCREYRAGFGTVTGAHTYYGYTKRAALTAWRTDHPRPAIGAASS